MLKTCVITGAGSGIGLALARLLASRGNEVVLVCRDAHRGNDALKWVRNSAPQGRSELLVADLSIQREVRRVATEFAERWSSLNVLINNASVGYAPNRTLTSDGQEHTFAVNCVAPFLLANLLEESLSKGAPSRVVNVVERAREAEPPVIDDLQMRDGYSGTRARQRSQVAQLFLSQELARRFAQRAITVNCIDPGSTRTALYSERPLSARLLGFPAYILSQSAHQAARTIARVADGPEHMRVTGMFFSRFEQRPLRNSSLDEAFARALWDKVASSCNTP